MKFYCRQFYQHPIHNNIETIHRTSIIFICMVVGCLWIIQDLYRKIESVIQLSILGGIHTRDGSRRNEGHEKYVLEKFIEEVSFVVVLIFACILFIIERNDIFSSALKQFFPFFQCGISQLFMMLLPIRPCITHFPPFSISSEQRKFIQRENQSICSQFFLVDERRRRMKALHIIWINFILRSGPHAHWRPMELRGKELQIEVWPRIHWNSLNLWCERYGWYYGLRNPLGRKKYKLKLIIHNPKGKENSRLPVHFI